MLISFSLYPLNSALNFSASIALPSLAPFLLSSFHKYLFCTYCVPGNVPMDLMDALCPVHREKFSLLPTHSPFISKLESVARASLLG